MLNEWLVVPVEERMNDETGETEIRPKYSDNAGINGFTGNIIDFDDPQWSHLPWHPNNMYLVRFYAADTRSIAQVLRQPDVYMLQTAGGSFQSEQFADFLNNHFDAARTLGQWGQFFSVGIE